MRKVESVKPGDRCVISSDAPFKVYLTRDAEEMPFTSEVLFVGPHSADLRKTSFSVPPGYPVLEVECDADAVTSIEILPNRFAAADGTTLVSELEKDRPVPIRDLIANEIARLMSVTGQADDPETVEEANDFDLGPEFDDEPWAVVEATEEYFNAPEDAEPVAEQADPVNPEPDAELPENAPERTREAVTGE